MFLRNASVFALSVVSFFARPRRGRSPQRNHGVLWGLSQANRAHTLRRFVSESERGNCSSL